jgi:hypothetical protein
MKEKDKIHAEQWHDSFQPLINEAADITYEISYPFLSFDRDLEAFQKTIAKARDSEDKYNLLVDALKKLPGIVDRMKAFPKSDVGKVRRIQNFEVKALNAYRQACNLGLIMVKTEWVLTLLSSGETDGEVIASQVGLPRKVVGKIINTKVKYMLPNGQPLDNTWHADPRLGTAIAFCLKQAHECWKASDKVQSAFREV